MKTGNKLTALGGLLIAAALCLAGYNLHEDHLGKVRSGEMLREIRAEAAESAANGQETSGLPGGTEPLPEYVLDPEKEMPEKEIGGRNCIGTLEIPSLEISLPVIGEWSYPAMKLAPCRYQGSAYQDSLIICGHNYGAHFGKLKKLKPGDGVEFTDASGNIFKYAVEGTEILEATDTEKMKSGDWDLTMFTCTPGGEKRVTVRCEKLG